MYPQDYRYTNDHEWIHPEGDRARVGITEYAQKQLGDIVFVETPKVGGALERSKPYGVVESVKSVSDLYAPVSGTVVGVNEALAGTPEIVNKDPYVEGWTVAVKLKDPGEIAALMTAAQYEAYLAEFSK